LTDRLDRGEAGDRLAGLGNDEFFTGEGSLNQSGELGFRFMDLN